MTDTNLPIIANDHPFWRLAAMLDATTTSEPAPGTLADLGQERLAKLALLVVNPNVLLRATKAPRAPKERSLHGRAVETDAQLMAFIQEQLAANPAVRPFAIHRGLKAAGRPCSFPRVQKLFQRSQDLVPGGQYTTPVDEKALKVEAVLVRLAAAADGLPAAEAIALNAVIAANGCLTIKDYALKECGPDLSLDMLGEWSELEIGSYLAHIIKPEEQRETVIEPADVEPVAAETVVVLDEVERAKPAKPGKKMAPPRTAAAPKRDSKKGNTKKAA
jgi:hypothetical protein